MLFLCQKTKDSPALTFRGSEGSRSSGQSCNRQPIYQLRQINRQFNFGTIAKDRGKNFTFTKTWIHMYILYIYILVLNKMYPVDKCRSLLLIFVLTYGKFYGEITPRFYVSYIKIAVFFAFICSSAWIVLAITQFII